MTQGLTRRGVLGASVAALGSAWSPGAWAQWPTGLPPMPLLPAGYAAAVRAAVDAEARGDTAAALKACESAWHIARPLFTVTNTPSPQAAALLVDLYGTWGRLLLETGRNQEAAEKLSSALELTSQHSLEAPEPLMDWLFTMKQAQQIARVMNAAMLRFGGGRAREVETALAPRLPRTDRVEVMLMEAQARLGQRESVSRLWQDAVSKKLTPANSLSASVGRQYEAEAGLLRAGLALVAAQDLASARQALQLALAVNTHRMLAMAGGRVFPGQAEVFEARRLLVSAYVTAHLAGQDTAQGTEDVVAELAAVHQLQQRFIRWRRRLLPVMAAPGSFQHRSRILRLEMEMRDLPTEGAVGIQAWMDWQNRYTQAFDPLVPALRDAGLLDFWKAPQDVLAAARQRLRGQAWIGFAGILPADPATGRLGERRYVRYTMDGRGSGLTDIGDRTSIDRSVVKWRQAISTADEAQGRSELSERLLSALPVPVQEAPAWILALDGGLALAPFEALEVSPGMPVMERHRVQHAETLADFASAPGRASVTKRGALVIADPDYSGWSSGTSRAALRTEARPTELPETRAEALAVTAALRSMGMEPVVRMRKDARPSALQDAPGAAVIHVACHGLLLTPPILGATGDMEIGILVPEMLAALVLSTDGGGDGLFWAQDALALDLKRTQLVVLSACDTANGTLDLGDALLGLRSAFSQAGARATLTSLWPVTSEPAVTFMSRFYAGMAAGLGQAESLQQAKRAARRDGAPVSDWAAFVLHGEDA